MRPEYGREQTPWPIAPRPFFDEAMGSWLGRIAGCYRMRVSQLDSDYELELPLGATRAGWLVMPPLEITVLQRLARLARINVRHLEEIQTPAAWMREEHRWHFCRQCLAVNRADLTAPYWQRRWFNPEFNRCTDHPGPLESLSASQLGQCGNMRDVIHSVAAKMKKRDTNWFLPHISSINAPASTN